MAAPAGPGDGGVLVTPPPTAPAAPAVTTRRLFFKLCVRSGSGHLELSRQVVSLDATWGSIFEAMKAKHPSRVGGLNTVTVVFPGVGEAFVEETETVADGGPADSVVTFTAHQPGLERRRGRGGQRWGRGRGGGSSRGRGDGDGTTTTAEGRWPRTQRDGRPGPPR